jgi:hypothetical protein
MPFQAWNDGYHGHSFRGDGYYAGQSWYDRIYYQGGKARRENDEKSSSPSNTPSSADGGSALAGLLIMAALIGFGLFNASPPSQPSSAIPNPDITTRPITSAAAPTDTQTQPGAGWQYTDATVNLPDQGIPGAQIASRVQLRLTELGYPAGAADGVWGAKSRLALRFFKSANGLEPNDSWDDATGVRLFSESAVRPPAPVATRKQNRKTRL